MWMVSGCHSPYVQADVKNVSGATVNLVELDYPSASFGIQSLAPGANFHYRFKILGSGEMQILWTDTADKQHTVKGPSLYEGLQGPMTVTITGTTATWDMQHVH